MSCIQLIAFDLDGTLVDSAPDIARAVDSMCRELKAAPPAAGNVREWMGDGVRRLVKRALTGQPDGEPEAALYQRGFETFRRAYRAHLAVETRVYPGARETLEQLLAAGMYLACITNKSAEFTEPLLAALQLRSYFGLVLSGDSLAHRKPDPLPLLRAARHFEVEPAQACMVGDSRNDLLAAQSARFIAVGVHYGYGEDLSDLKPDAVLNSLAELPPLLQSWNTGLASASINR
ncbi:MAG: phosphoglycolate phosphatase [Gammaproteobacteria bacterium]